MQRKLNIYFLLKLHFKYCCHYMWNYDIEAFTN